MGERMKVRGKVMWASVHTARNKSKDPAHGKAYSVEFIVDNETAAELVEAGLKASLTRNPDGSSSVKSYDDLPGKVFKFSRKEELGAPSVVDSKGNHFSNLVGNGSECIAYIDVYDHRYGTSAALEAVQIIDLVPYEKPGIKVDIIEGGFVAETASSDGKDEDVI